MKIIALLALGACSAHQSSVPYAPDAFISTGSDSGSGSDTTPPPDAAPLPVLGCDTAPPLAGTGTVTNWTRLTGNVTVNFFGDGTYAVDATKFDSIWGGSTHKTWPGQYGLIADFPLTLNKYISAELAVPAGYFENNPTYYGNYSIGESAYSAPVSITISEHCGDFGQLQPTTIVPGCEMIAGGADDFLNWNGAASACKLESGKRYYLNIINADITTLPATTTQRPQKCINDMCQTPVMDGYGTWKN